MKRILVVDDDEQLRANLVEVLRYEGYETIEAQDGQTGIDQAQIEIPDLIICDISMPGLSGFDVISELRGDLRTVKIPVILLSVHSEPAYVRRGKQLGAVAHLPKPYRLEILLQSIRTQIGS